MRLNYLYCFLFGIIIYFIFNNNEGFSVSGKDIGDDCFNDDDCNDNFGWNSSDCNKNCSCFNYRCVSENTCVQEDCNDGEFCHNDGTCKVMVTKELLEKEYGYKFSEPIAMKGIFKLYYIDEFNKIKGGIKELYEGSGNSLPYFAVPFRDLVDGFDWEDTRFFYLTENTDRGEIIRARVSVEEWDFPSSPSRLKHFSTVPPGYGYGEKLMFLVSKARVEHESYQNLQITEFQPVRGSEKAYRNLFRLSVGPTWPKKGDEPFSIFKPSKDLMKALYIVPHGRYVVFRDAQAARAQELQKLYAEGEKYWNDILKNFDIKSDKDNDTFYLFLMSLSEEDVQKYLKDFNLENTEQNEEFRKKYDAFLKSL